LPWRYHVPLAVRVECLQKMLSPSPKAVTPAKSQRSSREATHALSVSFQIPMAHYSLFLEEVECRYKALPTSRATARCGCCVSTALRTAMPPSTMSSTISLSSIAVRALSIVLAWWCCRHQPSLLPSSCLTPLPSQTGFLRFDLCPDPALCPPCVLEPFDNIIFNLIW